MPRSQQHDPHRRKARIAARIWRKQRLGTSLSPRNERWKQILADDSAVDNAAIGEALFRIEVELFTRIWSTARVLPRAFTLNLDSIRW